MAKMAEPLRRWKVVCIANNEFVCPPWWRAYNNFGPYKIDKIMRARKTLGGYSYGFHVFATRKAARADLVKWRRGTYSPVTLGRLCVIRVEIPLGAKCLGDGNGFSMRYSRMRIPPDQSAIRRLLRLRRVKP